MPQGSIGLNALTGHIHNFERWKSDLSRSLKSFRLWLRRNDLFSETVDKRLFNLLSVLKDDYVTIAFAGEFSRGKTELINAMFFARYGQRILPSQAGRTTMCPTELFYDREKDQTYIKLLSIDTRNDPRPLTEFRELDDYWLEFPLDTDSAESMADSLRRVTETKLVSKEEAEELGFDSEHLDQEGELVEVPKWRHALVSFDHPMLQKGLCILDTPGLNALGSEPELTLSLLPSAQAVIFLLAADAGVTASDMKIWDEHISQLKNRPNLGLYAVLNKVDVLWDDLSTEQQIQANVDNVIQTTAKQLDIPEKNVIPVSAQKALLGRVKADDELFNKSRLQHLEDILSQTIMGTKEENLWHDVIVDASEIVRDSLGLLTNRHKQLIQQREEVQSVKEMSSGEVEQLAEKLQAQKQTYQSQLLNFKPSLKLVERQAQMLKDTLAPDKIQAEIDSAAEQMTNSKSSVGMLKAMRNFFIQVDKMMIDFCHEAERCNRLAESTFERYQDDDNHDPFVPRLLTAKRLRRELNTIFADSDKFNRHLKLAFTGRSKVVSRFFNTTVYNISQFLDGVRHRVDEWSTHVLHPINQQLSEQKRLFENYQNDFLAHRKSGSDASGRLKALNMLINDIESELELCQNTADLLKRFKPEPEKSNIVQFQQKRFNF
ncbi:MAG: hypothetical protein HKP09_06790 [Enterobacterales bacterium]|nr:hypothetical protein [Enterobacterales bacterium]